MGSFDDIPDPPCDNPSKYCRLCFSQFRVELLFPAANSATHTLPDIIASLVQVNLHPMTEPKAAICGMCKEQIMQFQMFRDRCRLLDQSLRRTKPTNSQGQAVVKNDVDFWLEVEPCDELSSDEGGDSQNAIPAAAEKSKDSELFDRADRANASFWKAISVDVGSIPEHISNSLETAGFCRSTALAMISATTVRQIEQNMRDSVDLIITQEASEGNSRDVALRKYYGPLHCHDPAKFRYLAGEVQTILAIAAAVQENGIAPYIRAAQSRTNQNVLSDDQIIEKLINKIKDYYNARNSGTEKFKRFFAGLPETNNCGVEHTPEGTTYVRISCTFCKKELRVKLIGGYFTYNNFIAHCDYFHYQTEAEFERGRKRKAVTDSRTLEFVTVDDTVE